MNELAKQISAFEGEYTLPTGKSRHELTVEEDALHDKTVHSENEKRIALEKDPEPSLDVFHCKLRKEGNQAAVGERRRGYWA
ncbi:hypothetical protein Droror1_Dr00002413, partial [Drosera rotundifolia]